MVHFRTLLRPGSAEAAVTALLDAGPGALYIAGGTVLIHASGGTPRTMVDLTSAGLDYVRLQETGGRGGRSAEQADGGTGRLVIGAATPISTLLRSPLSALAARGLIPTAAQTLATHTVRNLATAGGNLVAWHFPTDLPPALLALDATMTVRGAGGVRAVPLEAFYASRREVFSRGDLIVDVSVPLDPAARGGFVKIGRKKLDVAVASAAAVVVLDGESIRAARLALAGLGGHPVRVREAEEGLAGSAPSPALFAAAGERAANAVETRSDNRASAEYRRKLVPVVVRRALMAAAGILDSGGAA